MTDDYLNSHNSHGSTLVWDFIAFCFQNYLNVFRSFFWVAADLSAAMQIFHSITSHSCSIGMRFVQFELCDPSILLEAAIITWVHCGHKVIEMMKRNRPSYDAHLVA